MILILKFVRLNTIPHRLHVFADNDRWRNRWVHWGHEGSLQGWSHVGRLACKCIWCTRRSLRLQFFRVRGWDDIAACHSTYNLCVPALQVRKKHDNVAEVNWQHFIFLKHWLQEKFCCRQCCWTEIIFCRIQIRLLSKFRIRQNSCYFRYWRMELLGSGSEINILGSGSTTIGEK